MSNLRDTIRKIRSDQEFEYELTQFAKRVLEGEPRVMSTTTTTQLPSTSAPTNGASGPADPFKSAANIKKRLKAFLWGDTGTGKTILALHFPSPALIDLERGSDFYDGKPRLDDPSEKISFKRLPVTDLASIEAAIDWLLTNEHQYQTLVIDPVTILWEAFQKRWSDRYLKYNRGAKGWKNEYYDFQAKDWMAIKADLKDLIRKLLALDMNVIVTAREKPLYKEGAFMEKQGETFDGEKGLPYMFDVVLRMSKTPEGKYLCRPLKDRTESLPKGDFESRYDTFVSGFGIENLRRKAKPFVFASAAQALRINELKDRFGISDDRFKERLETYGAETIEELSQENASLIITKLEAAVKAREASAQAAATQLSASAPAAPFVATA